MDLRQIVELYKKLAGGFGKALPLSAFGLPQKEIERIFGALDEDYHLSRFVYFNNLSGAEAFSINGFPQTHVTIESGVTETL